MGNIVVADYPWLHPVNRVPNCLIITADGSPQLKFQVGGSILERSPLYPRDWTIRYYLKGWQTAQASTRHGPKTWMSWLKLEYNKPVTLAQLVEKVQAARENNIMESPLVAMKRLSEETK